MTLIFHGRFPGEKAGSLFAAKSAEAFADEGVAVTLLVPRRYDRVRKTPYEYWGVRENFSVRYLPIIDFYSIPFLRVVAFPLSLVTFTISVFFYLLFNPQKRELVYSNEVVPIFLPMFFIRRAVLEVHDYPWGMRWLWKVALRRMHLVIATNAWKAKELIREFGIAPGKMFTEQNAVDIEAFSPNVGKQEARARLGLLAEGPIVLYTGHLYAWKGVDTLAEAARHMPETPVYFVGGTAEDTEPFKKKYSTVRNIHVTGFQPYSAMPLWQKAADVLVLPNTAREEISARYTSPMKLFEYMASGTPIVASDIPSVREIIDESCAAFFKADDARALAAVIRGVGEHKEESAARAEKARERVREHTWKARARRILAALK